MKYPLLNSMKTLLSALIFLTIVVAGCTGTHDSNKRAKYYAPAKKRVSLSNSNTNKIKRTLYSQFKKWKSVKYKLGGLSKRGIDCSGFVYLTYINRFGIKLPRTTALQVRAGSRVSKNKLKAGDLVFFKTSVKVRHVGIYIEDGKFIHASTSKGVTMSSLNSNYWSKKYWKSIRVKT